MDILDAVSTRLYELRTETGETQEQVALASDTTKVAYQRYETRQRLPKLDILSAIADHFDVSLDYLAGRTDARNTLDNLPPNYTKLSEDEQVLLDRYRRLGPEGKESVRSRALDNLRFEAASRESVAE